MVYTLNSPVVKTRRSVRSFVEPIYVKETSRKSISYLQCKIWSGLDRNIKTSTSTNSLTHTLKTIPKKQILIYWSQPEVSYKTGSVHPSYHPSFCLWVFLELAQCFPKLSMVLGAHILLSVIELDFFWKKFPSSKNDQKWSKTAQIRVFGLFKKIMPLVLSGISVKQSSYGSLTLCKNCMLGKNLVLRL